MRNISALNCSSAVNRTSRTSVTTGAQNAPSLAQINLTLDDWAHSEKSTAAQGEIVRRMKDCRSAGNPILELSGLSQTEWPAYLPSHLKQITASNNRYRTLPMLPPLLQHADLSNNSFRTFPAFPKEMVTINLAGNKIADLTHLDGLKLSRVDLYGNRLHHFPEEVFKLPQTCEVDLRANRFSPRKLAAIEQKMAAPDYRGPHVIHDTARTSAASCAIL